MITVHHLADSRSQRILWLLEELGIEYDVKRYARQRTGEAPPELKAVNPLGTAPVLTDGTRTLIESGAIIEFLTAEAGDQLVPPRGTPEHQRYLFWLHYAEASLMPLLLVKLLVSKLREPPVPFFVRPVTGVFVDQFESRFTTPRLKTHFDFIENALKEGSWLAGEHLTGADIQMSFPLEAAAKGRGLTAEYEKTHEYLRRIHARPAYQRALARGGPYAYA